MGVVRCQPRMREPVVLAASQEESVPPLVSVVIRSIGRRSLDEALESVATQTYARIEVVVVNALGPDHPRVRDRCGPFSVRVCGGEPLRRSQAANEGLRDARGEFVIFLDDDDLFLPHHVADLFAALGSEPRAVLAYADVVGRGPGGEDVHLFAEPFSEAALMAGNYIPLHGALIRRSALTAGCRFDESLDAYEDWDLFLQLARLGPFVHVQGTGAVYRWGGRSRVGLAPDADAGWSGRAKVFAKWKALWSGDDMVSLVEHLNDQIRSLQHRAGESAECEKAAVRERDDLTAKAARLVGERDALAATLAAAQASYSWRLTRPLRWLGAKLHPQA